MDPQSKAVTLIGTFAGLGGGTGDTSITDLAVNAAGDVYVNSEVVIYKAALPAGGTGSVALTKVATIAAQSDQALLRPRVHPGERARRRDGRGARRR